MIIRLDSNTITEIKRNNFINDKEYYKYLMTNALKETPKFLNNNTELKKKIVNNVVNNSDKFVKKFIN